MHSSTVKTREVITFGVFQQSIFYDHFIHVHGPTNWVCRPIYTVVYINYYP